MGREAILTAQLQLAVKCCQRKTVSETSMEGKKKIWRKQQQQQKPKHQAKPQPINTII